jgi:ribonuclease H2 subunit B
MFVKSNDGATIYELLQFNEKHRSFFIGSTVCSNGKIYLTTKIDPLFIFVQYLEEQCKTRAQPLDQVLEGPAGLFLKVLKIEQMKMIADQKGPDDLRAFMYNEKKTLQWLKKKFMIIQKSLRAQHIVSGGATSMNFVKSSADEEIVDEDAINEAALGIISEYISLDLIDNLDKFYGISEKSKEPIAQKRKSEVAEKEGDRKRIKMEEQENLPGASPTNALKAPPKITTKTKAFEKAAKGSKSISSFFTKK